MDSGEMLSETKLNSLLSGRTLSAFTMLVGSAAMLGHVALTTLRVCRTFLELLLRLMFQRKHCEKH